MLSAPIVAPVRFCALDVSGLRSLVSAAEQNHQLAPFTPIIDPVTRSDVNPHLEDFADALRIPEVSQAKPSDASPDPRSPHSVFEAQLPFGEGLSTVRRGIDPDLVLFRHEAIVALKLLSRHPALSRAKRLCLITEARLRDLR
jgi:hypothetical protein